MVMIIFYLKSRMTEQQRSSILWFTLKVATTARLGPGWSLDPGAPTTSPTWIAGTATWPINHCHDCFPDPLAQLDWKQTIVFKLKQLLKPLCQHACPCPAHFSLNLHRLKGWGRYHNVTGLCQDFENSVPEELGPSWCSWADSPLPNKPNSLQPEWWRSSELAPTSGL